MAEDPSVEARVAPGDEPFAVRLRQAIRDRGLSLQGIVQELRRRGAPVTIATLSYWQSGRSRPERSKSLEALAELERVLELPSGELSSRLPQRKPRGRYARSAPRPEEERRYLQSYDTVNEIMVQLGLPWNDALQRLSIHDRMHIDRFRRARRMVHRMVLRSERDGVEALVHVYQPDESITTDPVVAPLSNCVLGRVVRHEDPTLVLSEMKFPKPLDKDEIAMIEFEVRTPTGGAPVEMETRGFRNQVREFVFEVVFDPRALPVRVQGVRADDADGNHFFPTHDVVVHDGVAQYLVLDVSSAHYGMRFAWTEEEARRWDESE